MKKILLAAAFGIFAAQAFSHAHVSGDIPEAVGDIAIQKLSGDNIFMLDGSKARQGNILVLTGGDGAIAIDSGVSDQARSVKQAIDAVAGNHAKFLINTHWHYDHTGGNTGLGADKSIIIAHENTRTYLSREQELKVFSRKIEASPKEALPIITITKDMKLHLNGEELQIKHIQNGHTDTDIVVYLKNANILHTGDTFFKGAYPFIDFEHGGNIDGLIASVEAQIAMINEETMIVPGHGAMANIQDYKEYHQMLVKTRNNVKSLMDEGKSLEEIIALKPNAAYDEAAGGGFVNPQFYITTIYHGFKNMEAAK